MSGGMAMAVKRRIIRGFTRQAGPGARMREDPRLFHAARAASSETGEKGPGMGLKTGAAVSLVLALIMASPGWAGPRKVITKPDWRKIPSGDEMTAYYPQRAKDEFVSGSVRMTCQVKADGTLKDCRAHDEHPKAYGFGEAALALSGVFVMSPKTVDGKAVEGGEVTVPLIFKMPEPQLGEGAFILTRIGLADSPADAAQKVPCMDGQGECVVHPLMWAKQPPVKATRTVIGKSAPVTGDTYALCTVGADGSLRGCSYLGDTSAEARTAAQATVDALRAPAKALDGTDTAQKSVIVPFHWDQIATLAARRP